MFYKKYPKMTSNSKQKRKKHITQKDEMNDVENEQSNDHAQRMHKIQFLALLTEIIFLS